MPDDEDAELEEREKEEEEGRLGPRRRSRDWTSRSKARDDVDVVVMVAVGFVLVLRPGGGPAKPDSAMFSRKSKPKANQKQSRKRQSQCCWQCGVLCMMPCPYTLLLSKKGKSFPPLCGQINQGCVVKSEDALSPSCASDARRKHNFSAKECPLPEQRSICVSWGLFVAHFLT